MIIYKHGNDIFEPQKSAFRTTESTTKLSASETKVLQYLIENNGEIITREKLLEIGWPNKVVVPNSLNVAIANLRKAFKTKIEIIITIKGAGFTIAKNTFIQHTIQPEPISLVNEEMDAEKSEKKSFSSHNDDHSISKSKRQLFQTVSFSVSVVVVFTWVTLWVSSWQSPPCISFNEQEICGNIELLNLEDLPKTASRSLYIDFKGNIYEAQ
ncbi:helix-turn-helix domain-containing protein [Photobacterium profundum]|uniref:OmpR/PhoB-type domain-containing protein n=1 Tax=Photobacterium profundum 3TCK TaxID=314280 RepID=Q1Z288_9GAMM|nr:helix-turn-helix domain-containing protein [Photobacterium profundum]EAS42597.1 hypothetical protein P3TCK_26070 [Photobacterium profundum 3TCK]PSV59284.1 helix-turn-helix domain-containing protein [Photobacterium profundum]